MSKIMTKDLSQLKCEACHGASPALSEQDITDHLAQTPDWSLDPHSSSIQRNFKFKNYFRTIAFVNAIAWIAHQQGHHPDLKVSYNQCTVQFTTHAINGLSKNDFICAAKINQLEGIAPKAS
jgi:4a-hydroxytetrahydrobiopterin dehydratase